MKGKTEVVIKEVQRLAPRGGASADLSNIIRLKFYIAVLVFDRGESEQVVRPFGILDEIRGFQGDSTCCFYSQIIRFNNSSMNSLNIYNELLREESGCGYSDVRSYLPPSEVVNKLDLSPLFDEGDACIGRKITIPDDDVIKLLTKNQ